MDKLFDFFIDIPWSSYFLLITEIFGFCIKTFFLYKLFPQAKNSQSQKLFFLLLYLVGLGEIFNHLAWIRRLLRILFIPNINLTLSVLIVRCAWALNAISYFSLSLLVEHLVRPRIVYTWRYYFNAFIAALFSGYFFLIMCFTQAISDVSERPYLEIMAMKLEHLFMYVIIVPSIFIAVKSLQSRQLPRILTKQLKIFLLYLITPKLILEFITTNPLMTFVPFFQAVIPPGNHTAAAASTIIMTYALYFSIRKMMGLRFLNVHKHVQAPEKFNFINDFKQTLEQLSHVTNIQELSYVTQQFCKEALDIPLSKVRLVLRSENEPHEASIDTRKKIIEQELITQDSPVVAYMVQHKILITDEIEFSNFYEKDATRSAVITFLHAIDADIFLPIYEHSIITGYIIVDRASRETFFSHIERDELLVFASYLGNLIYLLKNKNVDALFEQEKKLREELYHKHREINEYKESLRSLIKSTKHRPIGLIFYHKGTFTPANHAAHELIPSDILASNDHPVTKGLINLARDLITFKTTQTKTFTWDHDAKIVCSALFGLEQSTIIIIAYAPEITDLIKEKLDNVKDPSAIDYLLYLETTSSGKLINTLLPGSSETLLQCKIDLLKLSLSRKALLLSLPQPDLMPTVELIHHLSLKTALSHISLTGPERNQEIALKLFGINILFKQEAHQPPQLELLSETGTIFIEEVHHLSLDTQNRLAEFLKYGFFYMLKSTTRVRSNARIICSSSQDLEYLTHKGLFSQALLQELRPTTLHIPSLLTLSTEEFIDLVQELAPQPLSKKETETLLQNRPASMSELRANVLKTSSPLLLEHATIADPQVVSIIKLGKHALKDQHLMTILWNKFQNQTKIATLLGVNRSSVNRRCRQYHLIDES